MRFTQLPVLHAQREQPAGDARRELLRARMQRVVAAWPRGRLDDAGRAGGFHELAPGHQIASPLITLSASSTTM
jgi:hypothetical protein